MTASETPPADDDLIALPCGEQVHTHDLDIGLREFDCDCGETHAVVMDVHPLTRFVPEFLVETLRQTITTDDDFEEFGTPHALAMVREEFPEDVASADCSTDGAVGYALVWVSSFDARRLHEVVVELIVELMEHAISHADEGPTAEEFERKLETFELEPFVEAYRNEREFEDEFDSPV